MNKILFFFSTILIILLNIICIVPYKVSYSSPSNINIIHKDGIKPSFTDSSFVMRENPSLNTYLDSLKQKINNLDVKQSIQEDQYGFTLEEGRLPQYENKIAVSRDLLTFKNFNNIIPITYTNNDNIHSVFGINYKITGIIRGTRSYIRSNYFDNETLTYLYENFPTDQFKLKISLPSGDIVKTERSIYYEPQDEAVISVTQEYLDSLNITLDELNSNSTKLIYQFTNLYSPLNGLDVPLNITFRLSTDDLIFSYGSSFAEELFKWLDTKTFSY